MALHIIDHKRVEMTDSEYNLYEAICKSYDEPTAGRTGSSLFQGHFETNGAGILTFVRPPQGKYTSLEVFCFLISLMQNQHLRIMQQQSEMMVKEATVKINELIEQVNTLKESVQK